MADPSKFFQYFMPLAGNQVQIVYGFGVTVSDTPDTGLATGESDNLSQLGDISNDHYLFNGSGDPSFHYVGKTADGIVVNNNGRNYLLSNQTYSIYSAISYDTGAYDLACYVTGTLIATPEGQAPVESLAIGDKVLTASGEARAIRWIGHRAYSSRFAANNPDILPILFKAGSLADNVPARDLMVSPKHAMFIDGVLIAAEDLVNGETIVQATRTDAVEYWHIELDSHDVLLAEGAPSESFVDDHSRGVFHNAPSFTELYPDAERQEAVYCAPRVSEGHTLHAIRQRLAGRGGASLANRAA